MSDVMLQLDVGQLQERVRNLTQPLSLRTASPPRCASGSRTISSTTPDVNVDVVRTRIQEMERRQHLFEALVGGDEVVEGELHSIRNKRIALEERQADLEQELTQWQRRVRLENSEPTRVHNTIKRKPPCSGCENLQILNTRLESLESKLVLTEQKLKVANNKLEEKETLVSAQKEQLSNQAHQLAAARAALEAEKTQLQKALALQQQQQQTRPSWQNGQDVNLAQREMALMRRTHELETARSLQQTQQQELQAERQKLQVQQQELRAQQQALKQQRSQLEQEKWILRNENGRELQEQAVQRDLEQQRRYLENERRELCTEWAALEMQRQEVENATEHRPVSATAPQPRSWMCALCCC